MTLLLDERDLAATHVVQFYDHDEELVERVVGHFAAAVGAGGAAIGVATAEHRAAFETGLAAIGITRNNAGDRLVLLDAAETLQRFLVDGSLDPTRFEDVVGGLVSKARSKGGPVHIYGEMVAVLWDAGHLNAAIELETMWNRLGERLPFALLCGYSQGSCLWDEQRQALEQVCHLHHSVLGTTTLDMSEIRVTARGFARREFPPELTSPRAARQFAVGAVGEWAPDIVDDVVLVVSELAANAVVHASSSFEVTLIENEDGVRVAVRDRMAASGGAELPVEPTHGLGLVSTLACAWGVEPLSDGKTVWAELAR